MIRFFLLLLILPLSLLAQKLPSIADKVKGARALPGFFNLYWDEAAGKLWLEVDQYDQEFLYVTSLPSGLGSNDVGLDRGLLGDDRLVKFSRVGRKLLLVQPNYNFRALTTDAAERRAVEQSFAQATLWGFTVEAETGSSCLVDATDFFIRDAMKAGPRLRSLRQGTYNFDKSRSAVYLPGTKNFPLNTEVETTITLVNNDLEAGNFLQSVTPSTEAVTLRMHHSFVQLPDTSGFKPRIFDPRSSFIPVSFYDYSTPVSEPIEKFYAIRHRLQKKDPSAPVSDPVKPIVYYLDNGTPEPIRTALLEGARWWNAAFEAAGYRNAFQVKMLPDTADPMDIRYNMINWVHRSTRGWSYGASVVDPRTGEIIKGQVTLGSLRVRQDYLIAQGLLAPFEQGLPANDPMLQMALNRLRQLSAHEVGHTLGLMHNYAASVTDRASVMDYPHPLVRLNAAGKIDLSQAYDDKIGEWDKVAIRWGYQDFPAGTNEKEALNGILARAASQGYQFISDRDARAPGGLHPQAHLWDNGRNAVEELNEVMKVRARALEQFSQASIRPGTPMAFLEDVLVPVYFYHRYQLEAAAKVIGGQQYTYALRGDGQTVTRPVSRGEEIKALQAILRTIDPQQLVLPARIQALIPPRPAGYAMTRELFRKRTGLAFDALAPAEAATEFAFSFLFHPERMNRMVQYRHQFNNLGLDELLRTLVDKTWKAPRRKGMEGLVQLQNEQLLLTHLLSASLDDDASFATRAVLHKAIHDLKGHITALQKSAADPVYAGHLQLALERMKEPEKEKKPAQIHKELPPGAPIGMDCEW